MQKNNMAEKDEIFKKIRELTERVFENASKNYKQKLVYNLLNVVKGNNQREFFWKFLRALNAREDSENREKLSKEISKFYPPSSSTFEKIAYSIILGILSTKSEGGA